MSPDFELLNHGPVSAKFLELGIKNFASASEFVSALPFRRNSNKNDLLLVLSEKRGTCGSKHAILKALADENGHSEIKLVMGLFKMSASYSSRIEETLRTYQLDYIPEAHMYLVSENKRFDFTKSGSDSSEFENELLLEQEISPRDIGEEKVRLHKKFLSRWLKENSSIQLSPEELWEAREKCIADLESR